MAQVNKSNCVNVAEELILQEKRLEKRREGREGKEKRRKFIGEKFSPLAYPTGAYAYRCYHT